MTSFDNGDTGSNCSGLVNSIQQSQLARDTNRLSLRGKHLPALDGVRGVAILLVLMEHLVPQIHAGFFSKSFSRVSAMGWLGVDLFFVLSGFLITGILYDTKNSPGYFRIFMPAAHCVFFHSTIPFCSSPS